MEDVKFFFIVLAGSLIANLLAGIIKSKMGGE